MVSMNDFQQADGKTDWDAYTQARKEEHQREVEQGKYCYQCDGFILSFKTAGYRQLCADCKSLEQPDEVRHDKYVRCPHCRYLIPVWDCYSDDHYDWLEDGEHEADCSECEQSFKFTTHVSYTFESREVSP